MSETTISGVIERFVPGGLGLIRTEAGVVLVRGGLVGERVEAEVSRARRGMREATVTRVVEAAPERVAPDCALHPRCGGCDFLDLSTHAQGKAKREMAMDALRRIARVDTQGIEVAIREAPLLARARRRARFATDAHGQLGYFERASHQVIALKTCPALFAPLDAAVGALSEMALAPRLTLRVVVGEGDGISMAVSGSTSMNRLTAIAEATVEAGIAAGVLVLDDRGRVAREIGDATIVGEIAHGVAGGPYASDAATFSQATQFGGRAIIDEVVKAAGDLEGRRVLELFAGAGHLTLPLAVAGAEILAIEGDERAVMWLERNVHTAGVQGRTRFRRAAIGRAPTRVITGARPRFDLVVADPPRSGAAGLADILRKTRPRDVILVSCDLATGARDLRIAIDAGFALASCTLIDAFPRTSHTEWVAHLRLAD